MTRRVFYNSLGTPDMYDLVRRQMPPGYELVTIEKDDDEERRRKIAGCEVAIVAATPLTAAIMRAGDCLKLIHHQGVGYHDTVDVAAVSACGLRLALTPEGTSVGVAEHAVLLALAAARRLPFADAELRRGRWHVNSLRPVSYELADKTVGYLGFGRIGREAALRFRAFETKGFYFDPHISLSPEEESLFGAKPASFEWILANADIISLHMPLTDQSRHIINADAMGRIKRTAIIINTARGGLVDDMALAEALAEGRIAAAGLDVFEGEPIGADHPLCELPNVVITPHISAGTTDAMRRKMQALFANVERFFRGEPLHNEVLLEPLRQKMGA